MNKIQIGNSVSVTWRVNLSSAKGSNTLKKDKVQVFLHNAYEVQEITDFTLSDNVVCFIFDKAKQKYTGTYDIVLKDTDEGTRYIELEKAFALVLHNAEERGAITGKDSAGNYVVELEEDALTVKDVNSDAGIYIRVATLEKDSAATKETVADLVANKIELGKDGKVPLSVLPSFVDDVQEFHGLVENVTLTDVYYSDMRRVGIVFDKTRGKFIGKYSRKMRPLYSEDITTELNNDIAELNTPTEPAPQRGKIYVDVTTKKIYGWVDGDMIELSGITPLSESDINEVWNK